MSFFRHASSVTTQQRRSILPDSNPGLVPLSRTVECRHPYMPHLIANILSSAVAVTVRDDAGNGQHRQGTWECCLVICSFWSMRGYVSIVRTSDKECHHVEPRNYSQASNDVTA